MSLLIQNLNKYLGAQVAWHPLSKGSAPSDSNSIDNGLATGTVLSVGKERSGRQVGAPTSRTHRWVC